MTKIPIIFCTVYVQTHSLLTSNTHKHTRRQKKHETRAQTSKMNAYSEEVAILFSIIEQIRRISANENAANNIPHSNE